MAIPFDKYWDAIKPAPHFESRKEAARIAWETNPDKQRPIMAWLQQHGAYPDRNPYFFIVDFQLRNHQPFPNGRKNYDPTVLGPLSHRSRTINETKSNQNIQMTAS